VNRIGLSGTEDYLKESLKRYKKDED